MNYVRQIREISGEREDREYDDVSGSLALELDQKICKEIFEIIKGKEEVADINELRKFLRG